MLLILQLLLMLLLLFLLLAAALAVAAEIATILNAAAADMLARVLHARTGTAPATLATEAEEARAPVGHRRRQRRG